MSRVYSTKTRVLVVSPGFLPDYAGWLQQTLTMIEASDPSWTSFAWIMAGDAQPFQPPAWDNLRVQGLGSPGMQGRFTRLTFGLRAAHYLWARRQEYDVVYCPWSYSPTEIISLTAILLRKPIVVRIAGRELLPQAVGGRLRRWLLPRLATATVVLNRHLLAEVAEYAHDRVYWFPNGVDTGRFAPRSTGERAEVRQRREIPANAAVILFAGSVVVRKGADTLLQAFANVARSNPQAILCFAGPVDPQKDAVGELRTSFISALRERVRKDGLIDRVRFLGRVPAMNEWMAAADIFVLPSRTEGMPNALLEAMATGLPCIAADIPGVQELITDGETGLLFAAGDAGELSERLLFLLSEPDERQRLGRQAREAVVANYSIQKTAESYQALFHELSRGY